jgi:hypothetical protein
MNPLFSILINLISEIKWNLISIPITQLINMFYIIVDSESRAIAFSKRLYELTRPPEIKDPADMTQYALDWITHPTTGQFAIAVDEDLDLPLHRLGNLNNVLNVLTSPVTAAERAKYLDYIAKGQRVKVRDIIPASVKSRYKTREEMIAGGWLSE